MKIAVCGSSRPNDRSIEKLSFQIGAELAQSGVLVLTGACPGYSLNAAQGAMGMKGGVLGISPAKDPTEHAKIYQYPLQPFTRIEFTAMGVPARNYALVSQADAVIIVGGQAGTLNEFTIAFASHKPTGVLQGSGGITRFLREISLLCDKQGESKNVIFHSKPSDLVTELIEMVNERNTVKKPQES